MNRSRTDTDLDQLCVDTIRTLSIDAVQKAESGHPGMPMGMADAAYVLWTKFLRFNPRDPNWYDRDRFVLSAGHGSMLLYGLLHLTGYEVSMDEIKQFRQLGSITPGHPEYGLTPGVETTTGPLGQGFATGIGMAIAEAFMEARFNTDTYRLTDHYTYGIVSDGDLMEGISHEAASLAGHLKLGKVIYLYDSNEISIDGSTELAFTEDVDKRFEGYNWHVVTIDGHDRQAVEEAIEDAQQVSDQPSLIICRTQIGFGSPNKQNSEESHGKPLGEEEVRRTKEYYGWDPDKQFFVPEQVRDHFRKALEKGSRFQQQWEELVEAYKQAYPEAGNEFQKYIEREIPDHIEDLLPQFTSDEGEMATRKASGKVLNSLADDIPNLIGGSADLTGSNKTEMEGKGVLSADNYLGRNIHYGVREHAMAAALNGMTLHEGIIAYGGTFMIFTDYCRPAIRIAALSDLPSIFVLTHDSIGLGEDGPTHQPIEHLASLRAMPNLTVIRPADANEVSYAWKIALERKNGPTLLVLTRQSVPVFERNETNKAEQVEKGAYIMSEAPGKSPDVILMGTGSELQCAIQAQDVLEKKGIAARVVSMPSWEIFQDQPESYRQQILPDEIEARISIEAAATFGWEKWVGEKGIRIGIDQFGASAPYKDLFNNFELTADIMVEKAEKLVGELNRDSE